MTTSTPVRASHGPPLPDRRVRTTFQVRVGQSYGLSPTIHHAMLIESTNYDVTLATLLEAMWKAYQASPQREALTLEARDAAQARAVQG